MEHVDFLIIGAGVTGLSFANFIKSKSVLILEQDKEIGGYCKTINKDGFIWDYSGHFFHFRNQTIKEYLTSRMPINSLIEVTKKAKIFYRTSYIDFPFQKNIHQLENEEFIQCLYDLYFRNRNPDYSNFKEMVYSKCGKSISDKFLIPYNEKLYACQLNELDSDAMGRFFPHADVDAVVKNFISPDNESYNSKFMYPKDGAMEFIKALAKDLYRDIKTNERVLKIDVKNKLVKTSRRTIAYSHLISSVPFPKLLDLTGYRYHPDDYSWNKVLVFNLGFDKKGPEDLHWIYVPEKKYRFYRVGFYDNILQTDRMSLYVEIGLQKDEEVDVHSELNAVLDNLEEIGVTNGHQLVSFISLVLDPAYVHITKKSNEKVAEISQALNAVNVYTLGRYGAWKYCSIEDNIIEAKELAERFNVFL